MQELPVQASAKQDIDKILVVGHPLSAYENVIALLESAGINAAKPSKNEKMLPSDISKALLKTHQSHANSNEEIHQLAVSPVWNGLALDLFLGNVDQKLWCWADSEAIALLDYWKSLDNKLAFMFVYDSPTEFLIRASKEKKNLSAKQFEEMLQEWKQYNKAILNFYYRNKEKSILVHTRQVEENKHHYLEHLNTAIGLPIDTTVNCTALSEQTDISTPHKNAIDHKMLHYFFAQNIIQEFPEIVEVYEELQSVATLFFEDTLEPHTSMQEMFLNTLKVEDHYAQTLGTYESSLQDTQQELEEQKATLEQTKQHNETIAKEKDEQEEENQLLLTQLHTVQEELEKHYIKNQKELQEISKEQEALKQEKEKLTLTIAQKEEELQHQKSKESELVQKLKQELEEQKATLEQTKQHNETIAKEKDEQEEENQLLLTQLHLVQEELERYYLENQKLKEKKQPPRLYGAAERIKQQLSYRLGAKMIENSRSLLGILSMPFSIASVVSEYHKDMKARGDKKLPPIHTYADAHEAPRVKQHLSYMLGECMLNTYKKPLGTLRLPSAIFKTIKAFKQQKAKR